MIKVERIARALRLRLPQTSFARGVVLLGGGTAFGQLVVVLASPLLTRMYTPAEFGLWAVFVSVVSILVGLSALKYDLAIPLPKRNDEAAQLVLFTLAIVASLSLLVAAAILALRGPLERWNDTRELGRLIWLVVPTVVAMGAFQVLSQWATRTKRYSSLGLSRVVQSSGQVMMQIVAGLLHFGAVGLIGGYVAGRILGVVTVARRLRVIHTVPVLEKWRSLASQYRGFPLFTLWASMVGAVGVHVPALLIARYFALDSAGFFSLTIRVLSLPSALVAQAVAQVFYPIAASRVGEKSVSALVERVASYLLLVSLPVFAFIGLHAQSLFAHAFGSEWRTAGLYAQYLAPWFMLTFIASPIGTMLLVVGKQREGFLLTLYDTALRLGGIWIGIRYASIDLAVALFAGTGAIMALVYIVWVLRLAGSGVLAWLTHMSHFLFASLGLVVVLLLVDAPLGAVSSLLSMSLSAAALTALTLWYWRRYRGQRNEEASGAS